MATDRRAFLLQIGSLPMIGGSVALLSQPVAVAEAADPIFAAIAEYKRLDAIFGDCCGLEDEVAAENEGREITEADKQVVKAALDASNNAFAEVLETVPSTLAGLKALLELVQSESVTYEYIDIAMQSALKSPVFALENVHG